MEPSLDDVWMVAFGKEQSGPHTEIEIKTQVAANQIPRNAYVWQKGWVAWKPISQVFNLPPPPPPPPPPRKEQLRLNPDAFAQIKRNKRGILAGCGCLGALVVLSILINLIKGCSADSYEAYPVEISVLTSIPEPSTSDPEPSTSDPEPSTSDPMPSTLDPMLALKSMPTPHPGSKKESGPESWVAFKAGYAVGYLYGERDSEYRYETRDDQEIKKNLSILEYEKSAGNQTVNWRLGYGIGYGMAARGMPRNL